jgi:hypothetical protein
LGGGWGGRERGGIWGVGRESERGRESEIGRAREDDCHLQLYHFTTYILGPAG